MADGLLPPHSASAAQTPHEALAGVPTDAGEVL